MMSPRHLRINLASWLAAVAIIGWSPLARCEEPAKVFLERMREERLFDLAARYLEIYDAKGWLPKAMKDDVKLERLMILQDSVSLAKSSKDLDNRLAALEAGFKEFFDTSTAHPRRSEAGLRLGDLSRKRGESLLESTKKMQDKKEIETAQAEARKAFDQAAKVYKSTQELLAKIITSMAGAKIASTDTEKIALRRQYQGEYRQAQILEGLSTKLIATTYPVDSKEYKDNLSKADKQLSDIISKSTNASEIGMKTLSRLYRGDVQALMGKAADALESYTPVADLDLDGIFRIWRVQATAAMVRLLSTEQGGNKFEAAIKRGDELVKTMSKEEQVSPEWLDLQLAVAESRLKYSQELNKQNGNETRSKAETRQARELLAEIARRPGNHQEPAKKLLADLGIEVASAADTKLPVVKTFAEALAEARARIDRSESTQLAKDILNNRLAEVPESEKAAIEAELKAVDDNANRDREQALALLQRASQLYKTSDSRDELLMVRFYTAFLFLKQNRFWEAAATSDFVARSGPGTDTSLKACTFALFSLRKLMEQLPEDRRPIINSSVESLAKYMIATWPTAEETQQATLSLLQNALTNQRWDDAERFLELLPKSSPHSSATRRDLGYILWVQYLISQDNERKAGAENPTGDIGLRDRAERLLAEGWESLDIASLDPRALEAGSALASLYFRTGRREKAEEILNREGVGLLAAMKASSNPAKNPAIKLEVLRLALQAKVVAASDSDGSLNPSEIEQLVKSMQQAATGNEKSLTSALFSLAKELRSQLSAETNIAAQAKLAGGIDVLLSQLAEVSESPSLLDWAGRTLYEAANGIKEKQPTSKLVKDLSQSASKVFDKMLAASKADANYLTSIQRKPEDLMLLKGLALRNQGSYAEADTVLVDILRTNNRNLTAQVEAAKNYQEWSGGKAEDKLKQAMFGSNPENGKNIVWGWGKLSTTLATQKGRDPKLDEIFFDARLQLATCRRLLALANADPTQKTKILEQSLGDLRQTYKLHPLLGGDESKKNFEKLVRSIQTDLGQQAVGLKAFD